MGRNLQDSVHIYVFADQRGEGWGTAFLQKAAQPGSEEHRILLDSAVTGGQELWQAGRATLVLPGEWLALFKRINRDPAVLRPGINWMADAYLLHHQIVAAISPQEAQHSYALNHWDNFYHVERYVDTAARRLLDPDRDADALWAR